MPKREINLDDVIHHLTTLRKKHGNLPLIQCSDDEGNSYQRVLYTPTAMFAVGLEECYGLEVTDAKNCKPNCICIN